MTYWETSGKERYITADLRCSVCNGKAVETEVYSDGKMILNSQRYPANFCDKHKLGNGTRVV